MKLTIVKCDSMSDWYVIERAEHDHKEWLQPMHGGFAFMTSARFSDADVEGTKGEMIAIAKAIRARGSVFFKRCSVDIQGNRALFSSPRNSRQEGVCSLEEADDLAAQIRSMFRKKVK